MKPMKEYRPLKKIGKLCYHYCSKQSHLPIRDILNDHKQGFKLEPNYETSTYNWCKSCNQSSVHAAVQDGLSHILFVTRYTGNKSDYVGHYFIVGYYEIGWTTKLEGRTAIRAKQMCFVPIEDAYEITDERWLRININGKSQHLSNLRCATQRISDNLLDEILRHLDKHNVIDDYLMEVAQLKADYNPFEEISAGRIFIINVGANTISPIQSPFFDDGKFEFVPIPADFNESFTYADLRQFNEPDKPMLDLFPKTTISTQ